MAMEPVRKRSVEASDRGVTDLRFHPAGFEGKDREVNSFIGIGVSLGLGVLGWLLILLVGFLLAG